MKSSRFKELMIAWITLKSLLEWFAQESTHHDVLRFKVLMYDIFGVEVKQTLTHADDDFCFIS